MPPPSSDALLTTRLERLRDQPDAAAAAVIDLRGVEHGDDPRFARSLLHYLESWAAPERCEIVPVSGRRMLILAAAERAAALRRGAAAMADALRQHGFGEARAQHYDLPADTPRLLQDLAPRPQPHAPTEAAPPSPPPAAAFGRLLDLEKTLTGADVEPLLREEIVWSLADPDNPTAALTELAISLQELEARLDAPLRRDEWLRHEASAILDYGMLRHIARDRNRGDRPLSFDLHVATALDPRFVGAARAIPAETRARLTVELPAWEAAVSAPRFAAAALRLADLGFSVAIDRAPLEALAALEAPRADVARIKAAWPAHGARIPQNAAALLGAALARFGADRLILWRCDTAQALAAGQEAGVLLFQGKAADQAAADAAGRRQTAEWEDASGGEGPGADGAQAADEAKTDSGSGLLARWFGRG